MRNYIQPGHVLGVPAPGPITSGSGVVVGALFGVAAHPAEAGEIVQIHTVGVYALSKIPAEAWAIGDPVYWNETDGLATGIATDNRLIGVAAEVAGAQEGTGAVRLNGVAVA